MKCRSWRSANPGGLAQLLRTFSWSGCQSISSVTGSRRAWLLMVRVELGIVPVFTFGA